MSGWVTEHDENSAMLFEKKWAYSMKWEILFFFSFATEIDQVRNAEHRLTSNDDNQRALPMLLLHS